MNWPRLFRRPQPEPNPPATPAITALLNAWQHTPSHPATIAYVDQTETAANTALDLLDIQRVETMTLDETETAATILILIAWYHANTNPHNPGHAIALINHRVATHARHLTQ